jgi:hypothetical protein
VLYNTGVLAPCRAAEAEEVNEAAVRRSDVKLWVFGNRACRPGPVDGGLSRLPLTPRERLPEAADADGIVGQSSSRPAT